MKKNFLLILILVPGLVFSLVVNAQEQFQLTQFNNSAHAINPAFSGIEDDISLMAGFRKQWSALNDAPLYYYAGFSATTSALKTKFSRGRSLRTSVPRYYKKMKNEVGSYKNGVGMYLSGDHFGPFHQYAAYFSYAFIYNISRDYKISAGISGNLSFQQVSDRNISLYTADQDQVYQRYLLDDRNRTEANLNFGLALTGNKLFAGYSVHQALSTGNNFTADANLDPGLYHHFMGGYNLLLNEMLVFQPAVFLRYNHLNPISTQVMARLRYNNIFWGGIGYQVDQSVSVLLGFMTERGLRISYNYDVPTSAVRTYFQGSHEFTLGFSLYHDQATRSFLW